MELGFLYAVGAAVMWGLVYTIDQKILYNFSSFVLLFIHALISVVILLPIILYTENSIKDSIISGRPNIFLIIIAGIFSTVASILIVSGIKHLDASTASVLEISYPFFVVLFSYFFFGSKPNIYFFVGGFFIFLGTVIIVKYAP